MAKNDEGELTFFKFAIFSQFLILRFWGGGVLTRFLPLFAAAALADLLQ